MICVCGYGLQSREDVRCIRSRRGAFAEEFVEEAGGLAAGFEFFHGGLGREGAKGGVFYDLFDVDRCLFG